MKVSVQYAETHLTELLPPLSEATSESAAPANGSSEPIAKRRGLFGAGKGEIWMAEDWDSPETNQKIARLFNDGPVSPNEP
jgi:hypothetical protein